jgi:hypothetical protein
MTNARINSRFPTVASVLFFAGLAALGLAGATRGGGRVSKTRSPSTAADHLGAAREYRERAAAAHVEAERHRTLGHGSSPDGGRLDQGFELHCQKLAAAAEHLSETEIELAVYHEEQARTLTASAPR